MPCAAAASIARPGPATPAGAPRVALCTRKSPAFWYCAFGLVLLGLTFWVPFATASRTARAEERGGALAELLLREAAAMPSLPLGTRWARELLFARLCGAASAHGVFAVDLELLDTDGDRPTVTLANKHYLLQLRPAALPTGPAAADSFPALEVVAWPLHENGPAHVAFFFPADADAAYTRNLQAGYVGPRQGPRPGAAHRRDDGVPGVWSYRGADDERWLLCERPDMGGAGPR